MTFVRVFWPFCSVVALALALAGASGAKGFTRVVLVGSDGRWVEARSKESVIDGLLSGRGSLEQMRGGYVRMFFVGPGDFPANPARYYPARECVALDWPKYERSCNRIDPALVRLLRPARSLRRFAVRPTVLASVTYHGRLSGTITTAAALKDPVELALDRAGRFAPPPTGCYAFSGRWQGPFAARRPRLFLLCASGIYADHRLYPLRRGVWDWFRLNVDPAPLAPWSHPLTFDHLAGWDRGASGNTRSAYVGRRRRAPVPLESAAWIAKGVRYRDDPTADPPNKTLQHLSKRALILWAVIYTPVAAGQKPIRLSIAAAKRFKCCEAAYVAGGEWELAGTGPGRAYSVIVRIYFGSGPTRAMRAQAQRALNRLELPSPQ
jgi:hypothetical protein